MEDTGGKSGRRPGSHLHPAFARQWPLPWPWRLCERYPKMQAVRKTVYSLPAVQGYYASLEKVNVYQKFLMDVSKC